ncbi:MAG: hypothetical protein ABFS12_03645 [Bacteroidota bacterium]
MNKSALVFLCRILKVKVGRYSDDAWESSFKVIHTPLRQNRL